MKKLVAALGAVVFAMPAVASAQQPGRANGPNAAAAADADRPEFALPSLSASTTADEAAAMHHYWRMEIERQLLTNPQAQLHARAAREAAHREARLEARRWWGYSASRPNVIFGAPTYTWWWPYGYAPAWHWYGWSAIPEPHPYQGAPATPYERAY